MVKFLLLSIAIIFCNFILNAQQVVTISGIVKDKQSKEVLIGATILDTTTYKGTVTDNNGYFHLSLEIPAFLKVSFVGYQSKGLSLNNNIDTLVDIELSPGKQLNEVTIVAQELTNTSITGLTTKEFTEIPTLGGKPDINKSLQMLPGINTPNEGSSYLLIRGGDPGQNLYLFDNVPVIHVNHLGGFMSVFNPDIINNIQVYKGGFPSRYGSKLSSIVDITQKEGNSSHRKGSLGVGITDLSFSVEGPIKSFDSKYIITGRKTLVDPLMAIMTALLPDNEFILAYGFHDINGKITWNPDFKNKVSLNLYYGDDYINYWADNQEGKHHFANTWGNWLIAGHWNSVLSNRSYMSNSLSFTRYRLKDVSKYSLTSEDENESYFQKNLSSIQEVAVRSSVKHQMIKNWKTEVGLQSSLLYFLPAYSTNSTVSNKSRNFIKAFETALYLDNRINLDFTTIDAGIRFIHYNSDNYSDFAAEPRLNISINLFKNQSFNLSYMDINQYSHLLITPGNIASNEIWIPSNKKIQPAYSSQYALGWKSNYKQRRYSAELSLFYKDLNKLSTYKEGYTHLYGDMNWQSKIESNGSGTAKGIELLLKKNAGKITGFMSYTLSNATRSYPNINNGNKYTFDFDRSHSFSMTTNYYFTEKISFNISWIYQTGLPYTPAVERQYVPAYSDGELYHYETLIYGERNSQRMRDYHRLDFGLSYTKHTKKRNRKAVWNLSIYNVYNRQNPYYYYYNSNNSGEIYNPRTWDKFQPLSLYQISFFPIIPTISYKLYFDSKNDKPKTRNENSFKKWLYHE
jgi:hypothetical protein